MPIVATPDHIVPIVATPDPTGVSVRLPLPTNRTRPPVPEAFTIDCAECEHQHSVVCDDCIVTFIVGRHADDAVVIDVDEARAVRLLEQAGLVPGVRHARRAG